MRPDYDDIFGSGFYGRLFIMLIGLKLAGFLDAPWVAVFLPVWLPILFSVISAFIEGFLRGFRK